ncbi:hypothetical protein NG895_07975 [Aeoliella sp. ICT_H6.2]|uniref:Uncharacterized protein n=1 Tax=Aeoliella straminimaris TaxID=2954799 RepID=A0A9X2JGR3_9BACT|nr:hypothetical protein [Aeoliella straminimaris]MCO6043843.1 hypothetical protein [Aeoliella straminimaris]
MTSHCTICGLLAAVFLSLSSGVQAEHGVAIPAAEREKIVSLVDELVALGMPDVAGGEYFVGPAYVQQQLDPATESTAVPMQYSRIQETVPDSGEMIYKYIVPGPHFRLADGSWLISLGYLVKPDDRLQVFTRQLTKRDLDNVLEQATVEFAFEPDEDFAEWFADIRTDDLDTMKQGVEQGVSLWRYLQLPRNNTTLGVCFLLRAGASDADVLCYTIADSRCRDYWRMQPWLEGATPFDPTEQFEGFEQAEENWEAEHETYSVEPLNVAFRRDLHRYFFHMLTQDDRPYSAELTAKLAKATLDQGDPQHRAAKVDALLAALELPPQPADDAELADVLRSWGRAERRMVVKNSSDDGNASITTEFEMVHAGFTPSRQNLPKLFDLLDDSRPTRWIDHDGAHSVGENALRAIAMVLEQSPWELIDRDPAAPWTEQSRQQANQALRKWWEANRDDYEPAPE